MIVNVCFGSAIVTFKNLPIDEEVETQGDAWSGGTDVASDMIVTSAFL